MPLPVRLDFQTMYLLSASAQAAGRSITDHAAVLLRQALDAERQTAQLVEHVGRQDATTVTHVAGHPVPDRRVVDAIIADLNRRGHSGEDV